MQKTQEGRMRQELIRDEAKQDRKIVTAVKGILTGKEGKNDDKK